jgi:hypothetical protein
MLKSLGLSLWASALLAATSLQAATLVTVTDAVLGGIVSGPLPTDFFTVGQGGTTPGANNWPNGTPGEFPRFALDGVTTTKYLNFAELNTGFLVQPSVGSSVVTGISFTTANDALARDPTSYQLFGSNAVTITGAEGGGTTYTLSEFTLISSGTLTPPSTGGSGTTNTGRNLPFDVVIANSTPYTSYILVFPTVRDAVAANSMQIGDAVLTGEVIPEPGTIGLISVAGAVFLGAYRRRK